MDDTLKSDIIKACSLSANKILACKLCMGERCRQEEDAITKKIELMASSKQSLFSSLQIIICIGLEPPANPTNASDMIEHATKLMELNEKRTQIKTLYEEYYSTPYRQAAVTKNELRINGEVVASNNDPNGLSITLPVPGGGGWSKGGWSNGGWSNGW